MPEEEREEGGGGETGMMRWLLTYADMITLLMALFIVLFALGQANPSARAELAAVFQSIFERRSGHSPLGAKAPAPPAPPGKPDLVALRPAEPEDRDAWSLEEVAERLQAWLEAQGLAADVEAFASDRGLVIRFSDRLLFDLGSAELRPGARAVLERLAPVFRDLPNSVVAEGHTDDLPIQTARYPSNWELSAARAVAVVRFLAGLGIEERRLGAVGYGEWRPVAPNDSPENRQRNRRVELVVVAEPGSRFAAGAGR